MCSTMQELAGTKNAIKLGGTDSQLIDPTRRQLPCENAGKRETKTPLVQCEMRILLHTSTDGEQQSNKDTTTDRTRRRGDVYNKSTKEHLNWHECKLISEDTYTGNGRINVQLEILNFCKKLCESFDLKTTTTTRMCSWSETPLFRKTG